MSLLTMTGDHRGTAGRQIGRVRSRECADCGKVGEEKQVVVLLRRGGNGGVAGAGEWDTRKKT